MLSRWTDIFNTDGEKEWRNRDAEFENDFQSKVELIEFWNKGWNIFQTTLESLKTRIWRKSSISGIRDIPF